MDYISAPEAAKKWGVSERRVQKLCEKNAFPAQLGLAVCGLFPKTQKGPKTDGKKKKANLM